MADRLTVVKTCKLFIGGAFPRSESGRARPVLRAVDRPSGSGSKTRRSVKAGKTAAKGTRKSGSGKAIEAMEPAPLAYVAMASRKDLRDAVEAATKAQPGWAARDAYNRGQILHRLAEMIEDRRDSFIAALREAGGGTPAEARREVETSIDRLISYAGWCDKLGHLLGTHDPVSGPYYAFTVPEATGVFVAFAPATPSLLPLVHLIAVATCPGNAVIAVVPSTGDANPLPAVQLAEACASSDVPGGVVNILTADHAELLTHAADHRGIDGIVAAGLEPSQAATLRAGAAVNLKRVTILDTQADGWSDAEALTGPWSLEPFVEMKTIWHPAAT